MKTIVSLLEVITMRIIGSEKCLFCGHVEAETVVGGVLILKGVLMNYSKESYLF